MKRYNETTKKQQIYLGMVYLFAGCSMLANLSQLLPLKHLYGEFHHGEMILIMLNDSYTGIFAFPFLLSFLLMVLTPREPNLFFLLTRFKSRRAYIRAKLSSVFKHVLFYYVCICLFSSIVGIGSSQFGTGISDATRAYADQYLLGTFATNSLIWEMVKIALLQGALLFFFTMVYLVLNQANLSQVFAFIVYTMILTLNAGVALGFFGAALEPFSIYALAGSVYNGGLGFGLRWLILAGIDVALLVLYCGIFEKKDVVMPKGNKQYQNE